VLKLIKLEFNNIGCFTTKQSIDFSDHSNLIQIDGKNNNTKGSSGAGKSTVFKSLDYLLGICDTPASSLQSRFTKSPLTVMGVFDHNGSEVVITRSKKEGLSITIDKTTTSGNSKIAEEKLGELLGVSRAVFKKMVHKKQKEGGFFLNLTPTKMYEFLVDVTGLGEYIEKTKEVTKNISEDSTKLISTTGRLTGIETLLKELDSMLVSKQKPIKPNIDNLPKLKEDVKELSKTLTDKITEKDSKIKELQIPVKQNSDWDGGAIVLSNVQKQKIESVISNLNKEVKTNEKTLYDIDRAKTNSKRYVEEIKKLTHIKSTIESSTCPTCIQSWVDESAAETIKSTQEKIKNTTAKILSSKELILSEPDIKEDIESCKNKISLATEQLEVVQTKIRQEIVKEQNYTKEQDVAFRSEMADFTMKRSKIEDEYRAEISDIEKKIGETRSEVSIKESEQRSFDLALASYDKEIVNLTDKITEEKENLESNKTACVELEKNISVAKECKRLIFSYVMQTFQEILISIGELTTQTLSSIPNMEDATIVFDGYKENADGKIKEEVTPILNVGGNNVPIKTLSGGERTTIDLAVDLSVVEAIETHTSCGADFYIIDEPFDGLDATCRESYLEALQQMDLNKRLIIVDHSSELKEMVSDIITVEKTGDSSVLV